MATYNNEAAFGQDVHTHNNNDVPEVIRNMAQRRQRVNREDPQLRYVFKTHISLT